MTAALHELLTVIQEANADLSREDPAISRTTFECLAQENRLLRAEISRLKAERVRVSPILIPVKR